MLLPLLEARHPAVEPPVDNRGPHSVAESQHKTEIWNASDSLSMREENYTGCPQIQQVFSFCIGTGHVIKDLTFLAQMSKDKIEKIQFTLILTIVEYNYNLRNKSLCSRDGTQRSKEGDHHETMKSTFDYEKYSQHHASEYSSDITKSSHFVSVLACARSRLLLYN